MDIMKEAYETLDRLKTRSVEGWEDIVGTTRFRLMVASNQVKVCKKMVKIDPSWSDNLTYWKRRRKALKAQLRDETLQLAKIKAQVAKEVTA